MAQTGTPAETPATGGRPAAGPEPPATAAASRKRRGRPSRARGQPNSSDAASARWTIRGVPPHLRDMALRAAEARGMTVGDWLAEAIVGYTRGAAKSAAAERGPNLPATEAPPDLVAMITRLEERMARIEERHQPGFFGRLLGRLT